MKIALWEVSLYSRYGKKKDIGYIIHDYETVPNVSKSYQGKLIDNQPCSVSFNIIKIKEVKLCK